MKLLRAATILFFIPFTAFAQSVAFTFDDPFDPSKPEQQDVGAKIRAALKAHNLHTTVFVAGKKIDSQSGASEISRWSADGHEIGNHTYSHISLSSSRTDLTQFETDAQKNQDFLTQIGVKPTRFRFPFLKEGNTAEKRDGFRLWLSEHGYKSGAVSIDASDWYYDQRYSKWRESHPGGDDSAFKEAYLDHLWSRATYYNSLATKYLGRAPRHILLLHANRLNARFLPDVIQMFKAKGWKLVDSTTAYKDRLYKQSPDILPAGESIIWQVAKSRGDDSLRSPGEDEQYEKPILDAAGL